MTPELKFLALAVDYDGTRASDTGKQVMKVHFDISAAEVNQSVSGSIAIAKIGAAIGAFNEADRQVSRVSQAVELKFDAALYRSNALADGEVILVPPRARRNRTAFQRRDRARCADIARMVTLMRCVPGATRNGTSK